MNRPSIKTFVAFDIETTGLPWQEHQRTKITEMSLTAFSAESMTDSPAGVPRVAHKLTLCLNPFRMIQPDATDITGLCNEILEKEKIFDEDLGNMINLFLRRLTPPVCLVAHNGMEFDFPILQSELFKVGKALPHDVLCIDSYQTFQNIFSSFPIDVLPLCLNKKKDIASSNAEIASAQDGSFIETVRETAPQKLRNSHKGFASTSGQITNGSLNAPSVAEDRCFMQVVNETTPEKSSLNNRAPDIHRTFRVKKKLFAENHYDDKGNRQLKSFKLKDIFKFLYGRYVVDNHRAEVDTEILIHCMIAVGPDFIKWADANAMPFNAIKKLW